MLQSCCLLGEGIYLLHAVETLGNAVLHLKRVLKH